MCMHRRRHHHVTTHTLRCRGFWRRIVWDWCTNGPRAQRFRPRRAAHSFNYTPPQWLIGVLLLLGQSFSGSLIQDHLIQEQRQLGNPSLLSQTCAESESAFLCLTLFRFSLYWQSHRRRHQNPLGQLVVLLICNVNSPADIKLRMSVDLHSQSQI